MARRCGDNPSQDFLAVGHLRIVLPLNLKSKTMTHTEVIERLCKLQSEAAGHVGHEYAADCFCGKSGYWDTKEYRPDRDYRNDGKALDFIESAVREKIKLQ
jgi:hypothetical protein